MFQVLENKTLYIINNKIIGEVTYPYIKDNIVNINHTFVDKSLRGQGVADKMLEEVFKYLKENGKKAICTCSYAKMWIERHPEYQNMEVIKKEK